MTKDLGPRLKSHRLRRKLTQVELAAAAGITQAVLSRFESGKASPSLDTAARLAEVLRIPVDKFLHD